jgi:HSP20 family protein
MRNPVRLLHFVTAASALLPKRSADNAAIPRAARPLPRSTRRAHGTALEIPTPHRTSGCIRAPCIRALRTQFLVSVFTLFKRSFRMTIVRYEPWTFVGRLQQQLDRALGEVANGATVSWIPHADVREEAERFVVAADLPGVEGKDIEITAEKGVLTIKGERHSEKQSSKDGYESLERATGTFLRRFTLPESVDAEAIKATHLNGVLEISIPKRATAQPRRITVQAA